MAAFRNAHPLVLPVATTVSIWFGERPFAADRIVCQAGPRAAGAASLTVAAFAAGAWFALPKPEAALPPAAVKLVLSPISEPVPMHEWFVWTRDGEPFQRYENWWEANGERTWSQRMLPGVYEVMITSETGRQETTRFVVDANDRPDRHIAIKMP